MPPLATPWRERLVAGYRALGDPTRLEILRLVAAQEGPTCVCDIVDHFELSQPTISHHLKVLREARLLTQSRIGVWSFYALDPDAASHLAGLEFPPREKAVRKAVQKKKPEKGCPPPQRPDDNSR